MRDRMTAKRSLAAAIKDLEFQIESAERDLVIAKTESLAQRVIELEAKLEEAGQNSDSNKSKNIGIGDWASVKKDKQSSEIEGMNNMNYMKKMNYMKDMGYMSDGDHGKMMGYMKMMDDMDMAYMKHMGSEDIVSTDEEEVIEEKEASEVEAKYDEELNSGDNQALEIDQDFLDDVEKLRGKSDLADAKSMLAIASERLDKVASYLEETGNDKMAFAVDQLSDVIDSQIASINEEK